MTSKKIEPSENATMAASKIVGAADLSLKSKAQKEEDVPGDAIHKIDFNAPSALVSEEEQVVENLKT